MSDVSNRSNKCFVCFFFLLFFKWTLSSSSWKKKNFFFIFRLGRIFHPCWFFNKWRKKMEELVISFICSLRNCNDNNKEKHLIIEKKNISIQRFSISFLRLLLPLLDVACWAYEKEKLITQRKERLWRVNFF